MKIEVVLGALIAATIAFGMGALALLQQEGVEKLSDVGQISWIVLGIGAVMTFLKDMQAVWTRKKLSTVTKSGNVFSPPVTGLAALLIATLIMSACSGTREAYKSAHGLEDTAKVVGEHYYALTREANALAESGDLVGSNLVQAQSVVRSTRPVILELAEAAQAYSDVRSAENEVDLQFALSRAASAVSRLIDMIKAATSTSAIDEIERDLNRINASLKLANAA